MSSSKPPANDARDAGAPPAGRRRFLSASAVTAGAVLAGFPMIAVAQSPIRLRWQGAWSARDICHEYALDFAKTVREMSGGRLRIEVLPAGAVVKPAELLDAVNKGILDGCHAVPDLWHRKNPAFSLFGAGPALGMDATGLLAWMEHGGGNAYYRDLYERLMSYRVVGFLYGPMPAQPLGWFTRPVEEGARWQDLRFGASGLPAQMFRAMGARVADLPEEDVVPAMKRGEIDGATGRSATADLGRGLADVTKRCMLQSHHRPAEVFEVLVNRGKFEALPADLRTLFPYAARAAAADLAWKAIDRYSGDYERLRDEHGVRFERTPRSVLRAQLEAWRAVVDHTVRENPFFESVFRSQRAWARRTVRWTQDMQTDARMAFEYWFAGNAGASGRS
jgi:TRAP-type mannitol/chloroaromatic compound transport system substrate-binding protein